VDMCVYVLEGNQVHDFALGIMTVEEAIPIENFMDVRNLCVLDFDRVDEVLKMRTV
jgi:hypothetical protein